MGLLFYDRLIDMTKRIVDLTLPLRENDIPIFPGSFYQFPKFLTIKTYDVEGPYNRLILISDHTGTHMNAPAHTQRGGRTVDQVKMEELVGEGVILNMPKGELEEITVEDLENANPTLREDDIVFFYTGWTGPQDKRPGLSREGAQWLVEKKIKVVGTDCAAIHPHKSYAKSLQAKSVHNILLGNDVPIIEFLANLEEVAGKRAWIAIAPLPLVGGSGSPVRAIAMVEE